ncbi:MAG: tyrosine-type recombinase/integrase [Candidatus Acidiferrales bacterium]
MQRGQITKHRGNWRLRYWDAAIVDGEKKKIRRAAFLAPVGKEYPTKRSVIALADRILTPLNAGHVQPESSLSVAHFIDNYYLPFVQEELRPSTYKDYKKDVYEKHLKIRLGELRLRDFRTVNGQRMLRDISVSNPELGHKTLQRIKSFLSGAFKHAKREGFIDGENPMRDTSVPGKPQKFQGEFYTMSEIEAISSSVGNLKDIEDKKKIQDRMRAVAVISVAAFAGLRLAEIRGLRWSDYDGKSLAIRRAVWRTHVGDTKNPTSAGTVPVLPILKRMLDDHRARVVAGKKHCGPDDYIFAGERRGAPLNLANMVRRVILPALAENEDEILYWKGWHAFRRALATNLHSCGVDPKVAQAILRHSDMRTTLEFYTMVPDADARAALQKIEKWIEEI